MARATDVRSPEPRPIPNGVAGQKPSPRLTAPLDVLRKTRKSIFTDTNDADPGLSMRTHL